MRQLSVVNINYKCCPVLTGLYVVVYSFVMEAPTIDNYQPNYIGRKPDGTFPPGNNANPHGRGAGVLNKATPFKEGTLTPETLATLETLSKPQLIALIKKVSGAVWGIALKTDEEAYDAICLKLLNAGLADDNISRSLPALKEWLDRRRGKPAGTSPTVQIASAGDLNVMIRLVDSAGNVESIKG